MSDNILHRLFFSFLFGASSAGAPSGPSDDCNSCGGGGGGGCGGSGEHAGSDVWPFECVTVVAIGSRQHTCDSSLCSSHSRAPVVQYAAGQAPPGSFGTLGSSHSKNSPQCTARITTCEKQGYSVSVGLPD